MKISHAALYIPDNKLEKIAFLLTLLIPALLIISQGIADVAVVSIGLIFVFNSVITKNGQWLTDKFLWGCLVVWGWLIFISAFAEADKSESFIRAFGWGRFILFAFALKYWVFEKRQAQKAAVAVLCATLLYVIIDVWVQYITGHSIEGYGYSKDHRLTGPFSKIIVGTYLAKLGMPAIGGALAFMTDRNLDKTRLFILTLSVGFFVLLTILITNERMAFLSFGLALAVFGISCKRFRKHFIFGSIAATSLIALFVSFSPVLQDRFFERSIKQLSSFETSHYGIIYSNSVKMIKEYPLMGAGLRNYRLICQGEDYKRPEKYKRDPTTCGLHSHNVYLEWASETGIIGMLSFIALMAFLVKMSLNRLKKLTDSPYYMSLAALTGLITFLWPVMSSMSIFSNWNAILFWYSVSWVFCFTEKSTQEDIT